MGSFSHRGTRRTSNRRCGGWRKTRRGVLRWAERHAAQCKAAELGAKMLKPSRRLSRTVSGSRAPFDACSTNETKTVPTVRNGSCVMQDPRDGRSACAEFSQGEEARRMIDAQLPPRITYISWAPHCSRSDHTARELGGTSHMV